MVRPIRRFARRRQPSLNLMRLPRHVIIRKQPTEVVRNPNPIIQSNSLKPVQKKGEDDSTLIYAGAMLLMCSAIMNMR